MRAYLDGKKTYILSTAGVIAAIAGWITGELNMVQALNAAFIAGGIGTARAGIAKS